MRALKVSLLYYYNSFTINAPTSLPETYTITINGTPCSYVANTNNTTTIATGLAAACASAVALNHLNITNSLNNIVIEGTWAYGFTKTANMSVSSPANKYLWIGTTGVENQILQYAANKGFTRLQFYDLYTVFGDPGTWDAPMAAFIQKAKAAPYNMTHIGAIMGVGFTGFQLVLNWNASHPSNQDFNDFNKENEFWWGWQAEFKIPDNATITVGGNYRITLAGINYQTTGVLGDTPNSVMARIQPQMVGAGYTYVLNANTIKITRVGNFLIDAPVYSTNNINSETKQESWNSWINSVAQLKTNPAFIAGGWIITAYLSNGAQLWKRAQAAFMLNYINIFELTNYTTDPRPSSTQFYDKQLLLLAQAASTALPPTPAHFNVMPLFSAQPAFMASYISTHGLSGNPNAVETLWDKKLRAMRITLSTYYTVVGYNYYDYNRLKVALP